MITQDNLENTYFENDFKKEENLNHIMFIDKVVSMLSEYGLNATLVYPEKPSDITIEIVKREPSTLSSNTFGSATKVNKPMYITSNINLTNNTEVSSNRFMFDNTLSITCWHETIIGAEKISSQIETIILKKYHFLRKYVDSVLYKGRLKPGFNFDYNDKKMYSITLLIDFRTSEIFYESNPLIREVIVDEK